MLTITQGYVSLLCKLLLIVTIAFSWYSACTWFSAKTIRLIPRTEVTKITVKFKKPSGKAIWNVHSYVRLYNPVQPDGGWNTRKRDYRHYQQLSSTSELFWYIQSLVKTVLYKNFNPIGGHMEANSSQFWFCGQTEREKSDCNKDKKKGLKKLTLQIDSRLQYLSVKLCSQSWEEKFSPIAWNFINTNHAEIINRKVLWCVLRSCPIQIQPKRSLPSLLLKL